LFPVRLREFPRLHGYRPTITTNVTRVEDYSIYLALAFLLPARALAIEERRDREEGGHLFSPRRTKP
jgi:hypothetical protein